MVDQTQQTDTEANEPFAAQSSRLQHYKRRIWFSPVTTTMSRYRRPMATIPFQISHMVRLDDRPRKAYTDDDTYDKGAVEVLFLRMMLSLRGRCVFAAKRRSLVRQQDGT